MFFCKLQFSIFIAIIQYGKTCRCTQYKAVPLFMVSIHSVIDTALLSTIEELQSALDRANEKLQSNYSMLMDKQKQISKLSTDVDMVNL